MRDIPFTQYKMPNGRQVEVSIQRPDNIAQMAHDLILEGYRMEIEMLTTGEVSMEVVSPESGESLAGEICQNGPQVPNAVDKMILDAHQLFATR